MRHPHKRTGRLSHRARQKIERARRAAYEARVAEMQAYIDAGRALRAQQAYEVMCAKIRSGRPAGLPVEGLILCALAYAVAMVVAWVWGRL